MALFGLFGSREKKQQLDDGLDRSRSSLFSKLTRAIAGKSTVDDEVLDALEETLVSSDVGVDTTLKIVQRVQDRVKRDGYMGTKELNGILRAEIAALMRDADGGDQPFRVATSKPHVIIVVGVNGVGKTTTIGKLAYAYKQAGNSVMLGAADTFRAAAVDQLKIWSERTGVPLVQQGMGADPAAVAYDTVESAKSKGIDVVIVDTAGRLHNKVNLMNELTKVKQVMRKVIPDAPHEVLAREFTKATQVTALALTKLDGTAKGGVAIGISDQFQVPIKYLGVGEGMEDLQVFNKEVFVESLFGAE